MLNGFQVAVTSSLFGLASAVGATTMVTVEAAGVQQTTLKLDYAFVETFDSLKPADYDGLEAAFENGKITGFYDRAGIRSAGVFGGAGGEGNYDSINKSSTLTLKGIATDYFGLWASAINGGESITFYRQGKLIDEVLFSSLKLSKDYYGNPTKPYTGADPSETFAFINFHVLGGFDVVSFFQVAGGRFETDNHTVGLYGDSSIVPEPATWMTMIFGLGLVCVRTRRRRSKIAC